MVGVIIMAKRRRAAQAPRAEPTQKRSSGVMLCNSSSWDNLICAGYTSLAHNPEICTAVDTIARLIGSMTIHLMENQDNGDVRIKDHMSRKIDIDPNRDMTRSAFIQWIVKTLFLDGRGNAVVYPEYQRTGDYLDNLQPIPPAMTSFIPDGWSYRAVIAGREYAPDEVLHFVLNPNSYYPWMGDGYQVALSDVANNLKQASTTERGFMQSQWKPSIIVKVDALTEEFASPQGRQRLAENYINTAQAGEPWILPADQFSIEQIRPLTLSDLALADFVKLDKQTVASILGVPSFVLGVGDFHREAWNNFVNSTIMPIAKMIEQELTKKLINDPNRYFQFNSWSLYSYSITEMVSAGAEMVDRMALRRNEWRGWLSLPPDQDMEELLALENYLPQDRLGDQGKLVQNGGGET